ncbi:MAG: tetratricopeptide repeat protein [Myxococcota bacterium]|nr:tetratricopeptide repeat protein [Myxococcota bacterium]
MPEPEAPPTAPVAAGYAGTEACGTCHPAVLERWSGSHHDRAMQTARAEHVLGAFDGTEVTHFGVTSRFFREGDDYLVRTEGPDGSIEDFRVEYVFGVEPLQQLLVAEPGGRLQAFGIAWDARPAEEGGQRWYPLHPDERIAPGDPLHWTGRAQRWNLMCAECHSTGLQRGYLPETDGYRTTWEELDVACEACHGPGAAHAASGGREALPVAFGTPGAWVRASGESVARRIPPRTSAVEVETCAPCHARRTRIVETPEPGGPLLDGYLPALLEADLYHADGQILDEVYVYGSFVQSRMFAAGVTCSDCHEPHGLALRAEGNALCTTCHAQDRYDTPDHHHHREGEPGSDCVSCHMPARVYMGVDARRDHGFRVPRPDLAVEIGVPEPCTSCHEDRTAAWAAEHVSQWRGGDAPSEHFARAFDRGRRGRLGAEAALVAVAKDAGQAPIVRATALRLLSEALSLASIDAVREGLADTDPLVRSAAVAATAAVDPATRVVWIAPLLSDPVRAVRVEAARVLAGVPRESLSEVEAWDLEAAVVEYRGAQLANADRPGAHLNLGVLEAARGNAAESAAAYARAMELEPDFIPAYVNLADLHRSTGRDDLGEQVLERALARAPAEPDALHAMGLLRVRQGRRGEALALLRQASAAAPDRTRYALVYAVALHGAGRTGEALAWLEAVRGRRPADRDVLYSLATIARDAGRPGVALRHARGLRDLNPGDPRAAALVRELERAGD